MRLRWPGAGRRRGPGGGKHGRQRRRVLAGCDAPGHRRYRQSRPFDGQTAGTGGGRSATPRPARLEAAPLLPVARPMGQDTAVPILADTEPALISRYRAKAKASPDELRARPTKAHDLPAWIWFALGAACVILLLLVGMFLTGR